MATAVLTAGLAVAMAFNSVAAAQAAPAPPAAADSSSKSTGGPRKQLATIIYAGLGGAILGLSTLSFYGRPQEKLSNIAIGFAFGVIIGTTYVTYRAASNPADFYGLRPAAERELLLAAAHGPHEDPTPVRASWAWDF